DPAITHRHRHHDWIEAEGCFRAETLREEVGAEFVDRLRLPDREMAEDAVIGLEARHVLACFRDGTDRHVAKAHGEAAVSLRVGCRTDCTPRGVVRPGGDRIVAISNQLGAVLGRGELGADTDLGRSERTFVVGSDLGRAWGDGDKLAGHGYSFRVGIGRRIAKPCGRVYTDGSRRRPTRAGW